MPDKSLFVLEDKDFNKEGLAKYARRIGQQLKVKFKTVVGVEEVLFGETKLKANIIDIIISKNLNGKDLTHTNYKIYKAAIDHGAAHALWPDNSYHPEENKNEDDAKLIYQVGHIIDDIRIERLMAEEYSVNMYFFKRISEEQLHEGLQSALETMRKKTRRNTLESIKKEIAYSLFWLVNNDYKELRIHPKTAYLTGLTELYKGKMVPIINRFLKFEVNGGEAAKEILNTIKTIKFIRKYEENCYKIENNDNYFFLKFDPGYNTNFNAGDEILLSAIQHLTDKKKILFLSEWPYYIKLSGNFQLKITAVKRSRKPGKVTDRYIAKIVETGEMVSVKFKNHEHNPLEFIDKTGYFDGDENDIQAYPVSHFPTDEKLIIRKGRENKSFPNPFIAGT